MKLVTFSHRSGGHASHAGVLDGETVACLTEAGLAASVMEIITGGKPALDKVRSGWQKAKRYPLADIRLEAPIRPGKVLCSGINYKGHALENPNAKMPTEPFFFAKLALFCLILDLFWLVEMLRATESPRLLAGYYTWIASFALLAAAGFVSAASGRRTSKTPTAGTPS